MPINQHTQGFSDELSSGKKPRRFYEILAAILYRDQVQWDYVSVFWGVEGCISANKPRSSASMAPLAFLDHVPLPEKNNHPIQADQIVIWSVVQIRRSLA